MKHFGIILTCLLVSGLALAQTEPTCAPGTRLFSHELMENDPVCIPENPQRIIALGFDSAEVTLFTDKNLVGAAPWILQEVPLLLPETAERLKNTEDVGYPASLEKVLELKPDLILTTLGSDLIDVAQASKIAPVIVRKTDQFFTVKDGLGLWASTLGVPEVGDELIANYDARIQELQEALGPERKDTEVSVISVAPEFIWLWLVESGPGNILNDVGLSRPPSQNVEGDSSTADYEDAPVANITEESMPLADGDVIFAFTFADASPEVQAAQKARFAELKEDPIWNTLSAVQAGNVHIVGPHWWRSETYLLANRVIDDLFTNLVGKPGQVRALTLDEVAQ